MIESTLKQMRLEIESIPVRLLGAAAILTFMLATHAFSQSEKILLAVDTRIGTDNGGNTFPGATVPFGMVQWSPDTSGSSYLDTEKTIRGFSLTHLSGAGCPLFGDMPILPWSERPGEVRTGKQLETTAFEHNTEITQPGYYAVTLADGTRVELTASDRSGMARVTYAAGKRAGLLLNGPGNGSTNVPDVATPPAAGREHDGQRLVLAKDGTITGTVTAGGFCGSNTRYTLHVAYKTTNQPLHSSFWQDGVLQRNATGASGKQAVAWLDLGKDRQQLVKVGLSYVSNEKARSNLDAEMPGWNFDAIRQHAQQRWINALGKIEIKGANDTDRRIFYTGLYHSLIAPTLFSDVDGEYMGFDQKPHFLPPGQQGQYTNISDWDTYRNTVQIQALLFPQEASDLAQSLVNDAEQLGSLPRWITANQGSYVMGGDSPPLMLASLYAFGARNFDIHAALQYMRKGALEPELGERVGLDEYLRLGYISTKDDISASATLEFANADFASAQLARALGDTATENLLLKHAGSWRNLMDPETRWIRPRNPDGSWESGFDAEKSLPHRRHAPVVTDQDGFEEGNTYQYTFMLPFDYQGLFNAIGNDALVEKRLDQFFQKLICWGEPCFNMANEPDFVTPYAYTFLGKPWKTASVIKRIEDETFNATAGGIPGNDDLGATSGVYVWNALGMYPVIPGVGGVVLGTPRFEQTVLHIGGGRTLTLTKHGSGLYVHMVKINGVDHPSTWLDLGSTMLDGTKVDFEMQEDVGAEWGTQMRDRPPSQSAPLAQHASN